MIDQPAEAVNDEQPDLLEELMNVDEQAAGKDSAGNYLRDVVINANSQEMIEEVKQSSIIVHEKETGSPVEIITGQQAYFALLAQDLINIATTNDYDIAEVHKIFYEVSCNRDNLIEVIRAEKNATACNVKRWQTLEDLALRHNEDTPSFQVVLNEKGRDEVNKRKAFLEIH